MSRDLEIQNQVSNNPEDANFRLTDVVTSEVSLVDAAANGRKFLIIKRKEVMSKKDATILKSEEPKAEPKAEEVKPAAEPAAAPAAAPASEEAPVSVEGNELGSAIEEVSKKLLAVEKKFVEIKKSIPEDSKFMFEMMANAMSSMCMSMNAIQHDITAFLLSDGKTTFGGQPVEKSVASTDVQKAGKKMAGERLSKLKEAFSTLESLIKELDPDTTSEVNKGEKAMSKETTETTVAKTAETSEVKKTEEAKAAEATPAAPETKVEKKEETAPAAAPDIAAVVKEAVEKAIAPLQEKIAKLEAEPVAPKGEAAAGTEEVTKAAGKKESIFKGVL